MFFSLLKQRREIGIGWQAVEVESSLKERKSILSCQRPPTLFVVNDSTCGSRVLWKSC